MVGGLATAAALGLGAAARSANAAVRAERVYVHKTVAITARERKDYLDFMRRTAAEAGGSRNFGVWATNGSTHRWAETVQMWERPGMISDGGGAETAGAAGVTGRLRLLMSTPYSPTLEELAVQVETYLQWKVSTPSGGIHAFLRLFQAQGLPATEALGLKFAGAYRALSSGDNLGFVLWAAPTYRDWARYEATRLTDPRSRDWLAACDRRSFSWAGKLLAPCGATHSTPV